MARPYLSDFERGYEYAKRNTRLLAGKSPEHLLELAEAFSNMPGNLKELDRA